MQPVGMDDPLISKAWHGEEQNYTGGTHTQRKIAGQENKWSRVAGVQDVAGTHKASVLAGSWHDICASREEGHF